MSVGRLVGWSVCHKVTLPSLYRITCSSWQNINGLECFIYEVILITRFLEHTVSDMLTETDKREICKPEPVSEIFISCCFFFQKEYECISSPLNLFTYSSLNLFEVCHITILHKNDNWKSRLREKRTFAMFECPLWLQAQLLILFDRSFLWLQ